MEDKIEDKIEHKIEDKMQHKILVAQVIINISAKALDKTFTYQIPSQWEKQIKVGSVVEVPFGKNNKAKQAYVVEVGFLSDLPDYELKSITQPKEHISVEKKLIELAYWMHQRYQSPLNATLKLMLPNKTTISYKTKSYISLNPAKEQETRDYLLAIEGNKTLQKRRTLLEFLLQAANQTGHQGYLDRQLMADLGISRSVLDRVIGLGLVNVQQQRVDRMIGILADSQIPDPLILNPDQQQIVDQIMQQADQSAIHLLYGITGSGKTRVYMALIEQVIQAGKAAILLIPEIGLTPQVIRLFTGYFGDIVGVLHSRLNDSQKYEQWEKAKNGSIKIMIGPRSAIFAPFAELGMIIIDEEHEHTYKSEQTPRYHAREVAIKRGAIDRCPVLLGSGTPLINSYYKAQIGSYQLHRLEKSAISAANRHTLIVDMRQELKEGNYSIVSRPLHQAIDQALGRQEQVILFLNRRGYANTITCRSCGFVFKCDACDVSMTYHKTNHKLICHICGKSKTLPRKCPNCDSKYLKAFGAGTQKIEKEIRQLFPTAVVQRMDSDTTRGKDGHQRILDQFRRRQIDILIGTQMIAKGHDFHNVTVVGVLMADLSLTVQDYRAGERTYQIINQVIGRTGRGQKLGQAFIQTYLPEDFSLVKALEGDYEGFYEQEILYRQAMSYPPFVNLLQIIALSEQEGVGLALLQDFADHVSGDFTLLGPAPAGIGKIKNQYRHQVIIKSKSYQVLTKLVKEFYNRKGNQARYHSVKVIVDFNPMNLS